MSAGTRDPMEAIKSLLAARAYREELEERAVVRAEQARAARQAEQTRQAEGERALSGDEVEEVEVTVTDLPRPVPDTLPPVVVGVDGSPESWAALEWAAAEARARGVALGVISAWSYDVLAQPPLSGHSPERLRSAAAHLLEEAARKVRRPGLPVHTWLVEGHADTTLQDVGEHAGLLVVGSRGLGPVRGALLGSVSAHLVRHAACPVAVVPRPRHGGRRQSHHGAGSRPG
jgi:nucleotide-binding universal stress UspA family protein